jgi:hypothetical protein
LVLVVALAVAPAGCGAGANGSERRVLIPAALPADVPLPAGAALRSTRDLGAKGLTLVFETSDPVATVSAQLRSRLQAAGWSLLSEVTVEGSVFSSFRLRSRSVALGISSKAAGKTVVGLCYRGPELDREGDTG